MPASIVARIAIIIFGCFTALMLMAGAASGYPLLAIMIGYALYVNKRKNDAEAAEQAAQDTEDAEDAAQAQQDERV